MGKERAKMREVPVCWEISRRIINLHTTPPQYLEDPMKSSNKMTKCCIQMKTIKLIQFLPLITIAFEIYFVPFSKHPTLYESIFQIVFDWIFTVHMC